LKQECLHALVSFERDFKLYFSTAKNQIESEISNFVSRLGEIKLQEQIKYSVLSGGKRLRPILAILSAESVGGNRNNIMSLALALEFIHNATLVHDDIIDQDEFRRGKPTVYKQWSVNDAILTGDALVALAIDLASEYSPQILREITHGALELCDGEHLDIISTLKSATEKSYFEMIRKKSASLFRTATHCGALAAGGTLSQAKALSMFGEDIGIAYQLKDDLLDLRQNDGMALKDLKKGRITLPLIYSYNSSNSQEKRTIRKNLQLLTSDQTVSQEGPTEEILRIIRRRRTCDYCETKIDAYLSQAVNSISILNDSKCKLYLSMMTDIVNLSN
jgi:geranylgeranyl pyrophosphate synthase